MTIEVLFDGMKNVLEADHTYMQNEQTLQGWMFINHITLQWYQQLYSELKAKGLLKQYSVERLHSATDRSEEDQNQWRMAL